MDELMSTQGVSAEELEAMSPVELAEALEQALESMTEETYDPAVIDAYLDVLDRKAPMPPAPDPKAAFQELQRKLRSLPLEESSGPDNKKAPAPPAKGRGRRFGRAVASIAAAAALLFTLMIGAQAAGMDIFGNLARWTDEHIFFIFPSGSNAQNVEAHDIFQKVLKDYDLPTELAPSWYPNGFTMKDPEAWEDDLGTAVVVIFNNEEGKDFVINIDKYQEIDNQALPFERDSSDVTPYTSHGRTFYIMSNLDYLTAAWSDNDIAMNIRGYLSVDDIKKIINSMGG